MLINRALAFRLVVLPRGLLRGVAARCSCDCRIAERLIGVRGLHRASSVGQRTGRARRVGPLKELVEPSRDDVCRRRPASLLLRDVIPVVEVAGRCPVYSL